MRFLVQEKKFIPSKPQGSSRKLYSHCGKEGHTVDTCYCLHGFPSSYKFKNLHAITAYYVQSDFDSSIAQESLLQAEVKASDLVITLEHYKELIALL